MAFVPVKGTTVSAGSSGLTAIGQCTDFSLSVEGAVTYDSTTIDQTDNFKVYKQSGHVEPGSASISCFYDSSDSGQSGVQSAITAATLGDLDMSVSFADSSTITWTAASISYEVSAAGDDGVKVSMEAKNSGEVSF